MIVHTGRSFEFCVPESTFLAIRDHVCLAIHMKEVDMGPGDIVKLFRKRILEHTGYGKYVNKNGDICNELLSADWIEVFVTHVARGFEIKEGFCVISFVIKRDGAARV